MSHCQPNQKPTIIYKFGNNSEKSLKLAVSPIDIVTKSFAVPDATSNYSNEGYKLTYIRGYNLLQQPVFRHVLCRDYRIQASNPDEKRVFGGNWMCYVMPCNRTTFGADFSIVPGHESIDYSQKCPGLPTTNNKCSIEVFYENQLVAKDEGICPITYNVQCGNCPDSHMECKSDNYPGYCCIPCNEIKSEIAAIRSIVRSKNG